jgi:hypothetical protein
MKIRIATAMTAVILLAAINSFLHFGNANYIRGDPKLDFDSPYYVKLLLWLKNDWNELPPQPFRMRILVPLLAASLSDHIGINNAFGLINSILWLITVVVYFIAIEKLYDTSTATVSAILFSFSVPVMVYGAAISTDMLGYFAVAASLLYISTAQKIRIKNLLMLGVLLYFSIIGRELSILAIGYILIYRILNDRSLRLVLKEITIPLIFSVGGILTTHILVPNPGYTAYFYPALLSSLNIEKILKEIYQVITTYHLGWIPILITLQKLYKKKDDSLISTSLIVGGGFVVLDHFIGMVSSRFVFLTYPGFLVAINRGLESLSNSINPRISPKYVQAIRWIFIALYIVVGFAWTAEYNISLPSPSDTSIDKLFPEGYPKEKLWGLK